MRSRFNLFNPHQKVAAVCHPEARRLKDLSSEILRSHKPLPQDDKGGKCHSELAPSYGASEESQDDKRAKRGFTLLETMVTATIFMIAALAIGAVFAGGLRLWHRVSFQRIEDRIFLAMTEMATERQAARFFKPLNLELERVPDGELRFVGLQRDGKGHEEIGLTRYWVSAQGALLREQKKYSDVIAQSDGEILELADSVQSLKAENLFMNPWRGQYQTDPVLGKAKVLAETGELPDAVRLSIAYKLPKGKPHVLERIVPLAKPPVKEATP